MKLFDDVGDDDIDNISKIEVNKEYAKRFEHNKKREDLQRLEELKKKELVHDSGADSESDTDPDSEVDDIQKATKREKRFLDALMKVKNKDESLKEKDVKLFESSSSEDEDEDEDEEKEMMKKKKPKYLKDVIAQQLMDEGAEFEEEEGKDARKVKSYVEEQEELRKEVLSAMAEAERGGEDEDFLKEKGGGDNEGVGEDEEEVNKKLDEYFGKDDDNLNENDMYLKEFFKNKLWIDREKKGKVIEDDFVGFSDDEVVIEKQEEYERGFNFRFEENVSDRVMGHSRVVDGSVRKETNARKNQRERKKERLVQAEVERQEEVKRLKNLKRKEIQEKLNKIREIAGLEEGCVPLNEDDLEEDFDPVKFDKKMKAAFGEDYYKEDDPEFGNESESDLEKPDFEKEDELLGLPEDWDVIKSSDGFVAERERLKSIAEEEVDADQVEQGEGDDEQVDEGKKRRKRKKSAIKEALDKELEEELYKLDYEDSIGDLKTRFKYREVKPAKYGLSAADILMLDEQELNQYVSLKKLAPYREKEWKVPEMQKKMFLQQHQNDKTNQQKRKRKDGGGDRKTNIEKKPMEVVTTQCEEQSEGPSVVETKLSRKAIRRRRAKEKKLPESRLMAYGKIPSSSKNKSKG